MPSDAGRGGGLVSGVFGGAIAGGTVKPWDVLRRETPSQSIERFIRSARRSSYEHRVDGAEGAPRLRRYLDEWLATLPAPDLLGRGASSYDLLNWRFRASQLIQPAFSRTTRSWAAPYMTAEWLSYWFGQSPALRFNRLKYRRELRAAYPKIFADLNTQEARARHSLLRKAGQRAQRSLGNQSAPPSPSVTASLLSELGDTRINKSLRDHLIACCEAFDARGLYDWLACDDLESLFREPAYAAIVRVHNVAMVEVNLRAKTLSSSGVPEF